MQRALIICGSAHEGGVTDTMCRSAAAFLEENGCTVTRLDPVDGI
ncbi:hypothetical protein [Candidatus Methanoprimaticola sp. MG2]